MHRLHLLVSVGIVIGGWCTTARAASPGTVSAGMPGPEVPYYHVVVQQQESDKTPMQVKRLAVNGKEVRQFVIRNGEAESFKNDIGGKGDLTIIARHDWKPGGAFRIQVSGEDAAKKAQKLEWSGTAHQGPDAVWDQKWQRYASVVLHERAGLQRRGEPVHLSLSLFADQVTDPKREIRVVAVGGGRLNEVACQVDNVTTWNRQELITKKEVDEKTGQPVIRYHATTSFDVAFAADVPAHAERVYLIFHDNPNAKPPKYPSPLRVYGEGLGISVDNPTYRFGLAEQSGLIETVLLKRDVNLWFEHKLETNGAVHWNPGCYAPPHPWVHASDWDPPAEHRTITGPVFVRTERHGPLPHMKDVIATVAYTFYAYQPYMTVSTLLEVTADLHVKALRNGEIVFNHAVFDEFAWRNPSSKPRTLVLDKARRHPQHALHIEADVDWLAFMSRKHGCAFGGIPLEVTYINRLGRRPAIQQPYIYVNTGPWVYWSRAVVYPFGSNNPTRMAPVPAGGLYHEQTAYLPFVLGSSDLFQEIEAAAARLRAPLDVEVVMDTDPRTPRQWVMPILTAPFDEGVEEGIGGRRE